MSIIKTPDQRVRIFISSTINELAEERKAAREAISNLRLIPVFFEAGARPHPPRDLYSAYLDQSHIFLGIYWNSYGWIAPGSDISGLEDEYRLCANKKPKLIYVKVSENRDPRLIDLLKIIENSDTACYQKFNDSIELKTLIENDLSILMSESFESFLNNSDHSSEKSLKDNLKTLSAKKNFLPILRSELIGRRLDFEELRKMITNPEISLVNILGAGGTGKTSLAIYIAHQLKDQFKDGVLFIPFAPITDSELVPSVFAKALDIQDNGKQSLAQTVIDYLIDKNLLIILDNFEQLVEASIFIGNINNKCPFIKIIVTSRAPLKIRGEYIYNLSPLPIPKDDSSQSEESFLNNPSVKLFLKRAEEVNSNIELNLEDKKAIISICQKLDGLPLAIELVASRTRLFKPSILLSRMSSLLDMASKGNRDLPARQQTLRNTIEWSFNLLPEPNKKVFKILSVFKRSWTLESMDFLVNSDEDLFTDVEDSIEKLMDLSLINPDPVIGNSELRFNMLQTVHEYAFEKLKESREYIITRKKFANYFYDLLSASEDQLWYSNADIWLDKIEIEMENIRAAFYIFIEHLDFNKAWKMIYLIIPYWHIRGGNSEGIIWIKEAKVIETMNGDLNPSGLEDKIKALTYLWATHFYFYLLKIDLGYKFVHASEELARKIEDNTILCAALAMDGGYGFYMGFEDAEIKILEAESLAEKSFNPFTDYILSVWPWMFYKSKHGNEFAEKKLEYAKKICIQYEMRSLLPYLTILKGSELMMEKKYETAADLYLDTINIMPENGLKGLRGGFLLAYVHCRRKLGNVENEDQLINTALENVRESGDQEALFHSMMGITDYLLSKGHLEKAHKAYGSAQAFIEMTNYPLLGPSLNEYNEMINLFPGMNANPEHLKWFEEGKKMRLEEAIVFIMN